MVYVTRLFVRLVALVRGRLAVALDSVGAVRTRAQQVSTASVTCSRRDSAH